MNDTSPTQNKGIVRKTSNFTLKNPATANVDIEPSIQLKKSTSPDRPFWLYVLRLEHGKYYVGYTGRYNPYDRIMQHAEGVDDGARWTELHRPLEVIEVRDLGTTSKIRARALERNLTWEYLKIYGANNVRGGVINYTGRVVRLGDRFYLGYQLQNIFTGVLVCILSAYIVFNYFF